MLNIRPATAEDEATIKRMIYDARLDPTSLKWQNFLVAELDQKVVGVGQVKPYPRCRELGSLVVLKEYQRQGIAKYLIQELETRSEFPMYLFCLDEMAGFYEQFGYHRISFMQLPIFLKFKILIPTFFRLFGIRVIGMLKEKPLGEAVAPPI